MKSWFLVTAALAGLMLSGASAHAQAHLGAHGTPQPGGGIVITSVNPGSNAETLGLVAGDLLLTIGNPQANVPDMLIMTISDAHNALAQVGDHVRLLVEHADGSFSFLEGDLVDDSISFQEELTPAAFAAQPRGKPAPKPDAAPKKPPTVKAHLAKVAQPAKAKPKVVASSVTKKKTAKPAWHTSRKDKKPKTK
jgi:hypothetical protein